MTEPTFGMTFIRDDSEPTSVVASDLSVVGLVLPSADADPAAFPYNVAVAFNSSDLASLSKLGTGPLYRAVVKINAQLARFQIAARIVAVRVPQGATVDETIANIVGDPAAGTGWYAMLQSGQRLGVIPRLLGSPGFTGKFSRTAGATNVSSAVKSGGNAGTGTLTLASSPAYGGSVKPGIYQVRCIGGSFAATAAAAEGNTGNGAVTGVGTGVGAAAGVYTATCFAAAANGGTFVVENPNGQTIGVVQVGQAYNGPVTFTIGDGSTDFAIGDRFTITVAPSVPANGGVFSVRDPDGAMLANATVGEAYTGAHIRFTIADGATDFAVGDGFDVTVGVTGGVAQANPICAALPQITNALLAKAYVGGPGTTVRDALDWRETITSENLIALDNWDIVRVGTSDVEEDGALVAIGQQVAADFEAGGIPMYAPANRPVQGIIGLKRYDSFSLTDGANDGQTLLANQIGITQRGELGLETAISDSGFVLICTDTCAEDPKWRMINVSRMRDYEHLALLRATRRRLGRTNITRHGIQAVLNDHIAFLSDLQARGAILPGWNVGFEEDKNNPENLRLGRIRTFYAAEEPPTLKHVTLDSRRNRESLNILIQDLVSNTDQLLGTAA
ncbi:hypothetical protein GGR34_003692 [Microvirga flocculans]|uniref:Phage tail protein n=1 Tax=Microvirga flocculans TaxID=217168 RepID=A0A7W6IIB3_9HYPH|nr:hypothetical protein [Microvirga flocculans]MBB4042007.1 hypothetical protein [Microvirga flocculans]